jgi:prefoldin subunit 5
MKLTKGKKQDEKDKKANKKEGGRKMEGDKSRLRATSAFGQRPLPEPPIPVRIQVEPRKAGAVSLEVNVPPRKTVKGRRLKAEGGTEEGRRPLTPSGKESAKDAGVKVKIKPIKEKKAARRPKADTFKPKPPIPKSDSSVKAEAKTKTAAPSVKEAKPAKSAEISASGEKKPAPSVAISIFNQAPAKAGRKKKSAKRKPAPKKPPSGRKETFGSNLQRPEMYRKASSVNFISPSSGKLSEDDMKIIKDFLSRTGFLGNKIAEVNVRFNKIARVADIFTDKVNSMQKEVENLKMRVASLKEERLGRDVSELKERTDEMESILEKLSDKLREAKEESEKTISSESKKVKSIREDMAVLQSGVKELRGTLASLNTELTKLGDFKAFVQDKAKEPQKEAAPDAIKNMTDRFDSLDSRMANMSDKLMKLGGDMQKLTDYFMDGMKHMESRIMNIEREKDAEKRFSAPAPEPRTFVPTTYRSHLKHPVGQAPQAQQPQGTTIIALQQNQAQPARRPEAYEAPEEDDDMDLDMDDDYDMPRRPISGPGVAMPQPPDSGKKVSVDTFRQATAPLPPGSARGKASGKQMPPAPIPDRASGSMFTRLRESTVVRRPIEQIDPDMDIIMEHIRDSTRLHESREKITRDLMNAGFDQSLISQAFMRYRVG